mgnify:CR=1 FL=1
MSLEESNATEIRQFQSETAALREAPQPAWAHMTVFILGGMLASLLLLAFVTTMDRVVTSVSGKIVPLRAVNVYQALDASIIKTIDVREGEQIKAGQQLATLDPTFAAADVQQLRSQIASLESQVARDEAEIANKKLTFEPTSDADKNKYQAIQLAYYDQHTGQYREQVNTYDAQIQQYEATLTKMRADVVTYRNREKIALKIEDMRTMLADSGSGSQLNMLVSQDARLEITRQLEYTMNAIVETQHQVEATKASRAPRWACDQTRGMAIRPNAAAAIITGTMARPSRPSVRFTAFVVAVAMRFVQITNKIKPIIGPKKAKSIAVSRVKEI